MSDGSVFQLGIGGYDGTYPTLAKSLQDVIAKLSNSIVTIDYSTTSNFNSSINNSYVLNRTELAGLQDSVKSLIVTFPSNDATTGTRYFTALGNKVEFIKMGTNTDYYLHYEATRLVTDNNSIKLYKGVISIDISKTTATLSPLVEINLADITAYVTQLSQI